MRARHVSRTGHGCVLLAALLLAGCMQDLRYSIGRKANIAALESVLTVGESSEKDVREALGPPDGFGWYLAPAEQTRHTMWTYYYEAGTLQQTRRTMLFVLIKNRRYDGYLWFTSDLASGT